MSGLRERRLLWVLMLLRLSTMLLRSYPPACHALIDFKSGPDCEIDDTASAIVSIAWISLTPL